MRAPNTSLLVISLGLGAGCWIPPPGPQLFTVPSDSLLRDVETVVLAPVRIPDDLAIPESVLVAYDSLIEAAALRAGFGVIPAAEYSKIWSRLTREAGGFFDPFTGRRDEPKFEAAVRQLYRELREGFDPDALLFPEIEVVEVEFLEREAQWDGTSQGVLGPFDGSGWALAISLLVVLERLEDGTELYSSVRGVEVVEGPDGASIIPPPFSELAYGVRAVEAVFQPLIDRRAPTSESEHDEP